VGDSISGESKGEAPIGGLAEEVPQEAEAFFINFKQNFSNLAV